RAGHVTDEVEDLVHPRVLAQHVEEAVLVFQLLAKSADLVLQGPLAQGTANDQAKVLGRGRLGEEVVSAELHRLDSVLTTPNPVETMTVTGRRRWVTSSISCMPLTRGILRSVITTL